MCGAGMVAQAWDPSPQERRAGRPEVQGHLNSNYQASLSRALLCCENKQVGRVENPSLLRRCSSGHHCLKTVTWRACFRCHHSAAGEPDSREKGAYSVVPTTNPGIPHSPVLSPQDFPPVLAVVADIVLCHNTLILWGRFFFPVPR